MASPKKEGKPDNDKTNQTSNEAKPDQSKNSWVIVLLIVGFFIALILIPTVILPALESNEQTSSVNSSGSFVGIDKYQAEEGYLAPLFELSDSDGELFSLESYRGNKPVLVVFETVSCGYCRQESPHLENLKQEYGEQIEIVTVSLDNDREKVSSFRSTNDIARRWLIDVNNQTASLYSSYSTPSHFFINKDGYIADLRIGYLTSESLERYIKQLIQM